MKIIGLVVACAMSLTGRAAEVGGVIFLDQVAVAGQPLVLNGGGVRLRHFITKQYVGVLYVAQRTTSADSVINATTPRRIVLSLLRRIDADKLHESLLDGLHDNISNAELAAMQPRLREMGAIFQAVKEVREGDLITLDFLPAKGTQISVRGQVKDVIAGDDLAKALLRVWLGDQPVSRTVKAGMLGEK